MGQCVGESTTGPDPVSKWARWPIPCRRALSLVPPWLLQVLHCRRMNGKITLSMAALAGFVLTAIAVALWGWLHSVLAAPRAKRWFQQCMGSSFDRGYRLFYNLVAVVTLLPVLAVTTLVPGITLYQIPAPWIFLTTTVQILALIVIGVTLLQTGASSFVGIRQLINPHQARVSQLQVTGFYRWVRHPLYTAGLVLIWLNPVMTTSTLALCLGFTLYIIIGSRYEERALAAEFGEAYVDYRERVPAIVPRPWQHY